MSRDWILTLAPLAGLTCDVLAQILYAHLVRRVGISIMAGAGVGFAAMLFLVFFATGLAEPAAWTLDVLTYFALAFGYWTFLNLNITSLRIRMLREIMHEQDGIELSALMTRYSADEFLRRRLERLELGKQMSCVEGRWRLESGTLLVLARCLAFAKTLIIPSH